MSPVLVSILALIALFVVGTVLPINMRALGSVAAWLVGMYFVIAHTAGTATHSSAARILVDDRGYTAAGRTRRTRLRRDRGTSPRLGLLDLGNPAVQRPEQCGGACVSAVNLGPGAAKPRTRKGGGRDGVTAAALRSWLVQPGVRL